MKNGIIKTVMVFASAIMLYGCKVSYSMSGASIDYNTTKTITLEAFSNRAAYQWAPMAPMFNTTLSDRYNSQTKLRQVKRDGDLVLSGEITSYDQTNKSISADGYSAMVQLKMSVKVKYTNNKYHKDDFDKTFTATREYDASQQLSAVQEELVQQMIDDIVDQVFNATVAKWKD